MFERNVSASWPAFNDIKPCLFLGLQQLGFVPRASGGEGRGGGEEERESADRRLSELDA